MAYRQISEQCAVHWVLRKRATFFKIDIKSQQWNILFIVGTIIGGFIALSYLNGNAPIPLAENSVQILKAYGFTDAGEAYMPQALFSFEQLVENGNLIYLVVGDFLLDLERDMQGDAPLDTRSLD